MPLKNYTASTVLNYSPRKTRLVINPIRGMILSKAMDQLAHNGRPKSKKIYMLLKSAAYNMKLVESDYDAFTVDSIFAEEAQKLYRMRRGTRGSGRKIARRYSRIKVTLMAK
jgi:ribosomal protein L22